jgi:hypothetical protein
MTQLKSLIDVLLAGVALTAAGMAVLVLSILAGAAVAA